MCCCLCRSSNWGYTSFTQVACRLVGSKSSISAIIHGVYFRDIWQWEWHALLVWGVVAAIAMPMLALYLRRALVLLMRRHKTSLRSRPAVH
jgi:hypothetical protein